ncbi:Hypothetical protein SLIV_25058 [Streptomyces lividans TK24]|uniref:Uncharacterized protein n=1 Tax=Streptomyces lividans TK24 TaxID=457428 RepID=A0ABX6TQZ8_STRLI|nr:Hypothetical protein SLIV_25058 [Streptomyces lividans TK24]QSJ11507.1 Hypothetical protein SLIVDG2_25058 [Streptomyces lividans]QTD72417.1 Hypothetical protein SLIVYQS_25058 [Streptomyces lividans TK24] [Streptomyces lividans]
MCDHAPDVRRADEDGVFPYWSVVAVSLTVNSAGDLSKFEWNVAG